MKKTTTLAIIASVAVGLALPVVAQYGTASSRDSAAYSRQHNEDAYQTGYRAGYDDGRAHRQFNNSNNYRGDDRRGDNGQYRGNGNDDRSQRWQRRYSHVYTTNDDSYYQDCRGDGSVGVVVSSNGIRLVQNQDCTDRTYAYRAFSTVLNAGRLNRQIEWRNPSNGHYGSVLVNRYANDEDGFRCANFSQTTYLGNDKYKGSGVACQQPDGIWVVVS